MRLTALVFFLCYAAIAAGEESKTRIANHGEVASEGEFPFQVSIRIGSQHFCGGSLISKSHVLTAAHCVQQGVDDGYFPRPVTVEVGSTRLGHGQVHKVKRISYHRGFKMMSMRFLPNDVAVMHLSQPVTISDKVAIINLPLADTSLPEGSTVIASGFGIDDVRFGRISQVLKKMDARVVSNAKCQRYHRQIIHLGKMCAAKGPGYGTCKGDSGGPLVDATKKTIIGIVSGGDGECKAGTPDVYTEVSRFLTYINEELNFKAGTRTQNPAIDFEQQSNSVYPTLPSQSSDQWQWQPSVPENPWNQEQPSIPENPWNQEQPSIPENPWNPQQPSIPENPWNPQQPSIPENPWNPQQPSIPENPWNPQQPSIPENPWNPQQPSIPENPWNPQQPSIPENPWNPQQPQNPSKPQTQDPLDPSNPDLEESIAV